ncbi:MAG: hypothetical protein K0S56_535 [Microvirga sp.]|jgi:hypothetical protein|nr:hypothetical protein [Microvirga sp.]
MSRDASISFDFGDGEHAFRLAIGGLRELQEKTGVGPMRLFHRLMDGSWMVDDAREVLRIGLIGGGMKPAEAIGLVRRYVDERPMIEAQAPAMLVLGAALHGTEQETQPGKEEAPDAATDATSSSSLPSTATGP